MHGLRERSILAALVVAVIAAAVAGPTYAVEDGLYGVRIGTSYRALVERFGPPHGILFPSGSGLIFQTAVPAPSQAGLPDFSQQAQTVETPVWVLPIRASVLEPNQTQWVYDFRSTRGFAIGILLNGEGADAVVSDVMVAGFPKYLEGKPAPIQTAKGVVLQSTFEDVLKKYGYPPLIEIYAPSGAARGGGAAGTGAMRATGGGGMRAGGGMRGGGMGGGMRGGGMGGGMRGGGMRGGGMRGGPGGRFGAVLEPVTKIADAAGSSAYDVVLTGAPGMRGGGMRGGGMRGGMRGGGMGGGMRGGGMRGGGMGGGARLAPLGAPTAAGAADELTSVAVVDHQQISFSRDCVMIYEGIAFTLHDMKVYRIHVSE